MSEECFDEIMKESGGERSEFSAVKTNIYEQYLLLRPFRSFESGEISG